VLIEMTVANYTRAGARRTMHHSLVLPREVAEALAKTLTGTQGAEAMAAMPGAVRFNEQFKIERVTPP